MAGSPYERVLAAEMLVVVGAQTADALSNSSSGQFKIPDPSRYIATVVVFAALSAVAMFGEKAGRLASTFGGVAALAILLAPTSASKKAGNPQPLAMSVLNYVNQLIVGGVQAPAAASGSTKPPPTGGGGLPGALEDVGSAALNNPLTNPIGFAEGKF